MNALYDGNDESRAADARESSMCIHFEVRDTGINKEKLKDMFQPFTQADASMSCLHGRMGLVLCIVQRFVELSGSAIWVGSETGSGSAFHFCVPLLLGTSMSAELSSPSVAPLSP